MDLKLKKDIIFSQPMMRAFAGFLIAFFLFVTLVSAFVVIPQINDSFEKQRDEELQVEAALEVELFKRFVESQKTVLEDYAGHPNIINAAMLSSSDNTDLIDLVDNLLIAGSKAKLILHDIAGGIVLQTTSDLYGSYGANEKWLDNILNEKSQYNFRLLNQKGDDFTFSISIPIKYNNHTEGVFSAEITSSLTDVFVTQLFDKEVAFRLTQGLVTVKTDAEHISIPKENSIELKNPDLTFTYITDSIKTINSKLELRNTILTVLFAGLIISFILFFVIGYRIFSDESNAQNKIQSKHIFIVPLVILIIGISAAIAAALLFKSLEDGQFKTASLIKNKNQVNSIRKVFDKNIEILDALHAFYKSSNFVSREEFDTFSEQILEGHPYIQALEWVPRIKKSELEKFESAARKDGFEDFAIKQADGKGGFVALAEMDEYYPVFYVYPYEGNEVVLGLDSTENEFRTNAIKRAVETGKVQAAGIFKLLQQGQMGLLVFKAVYKKQPDTDVKQNERELEGLTLMVVKAKDTINEGLALDGIDFESVNISIQDITNDANIIEVYNSPVLPEIGGEYTYSSTLDIVGRKWRFSISPTAAYIDEKHSGAFWMLFAGVLLSCFVSYVMLQQIRRRTIVEGIVDKRTVELKESQSFLELIMESNPDLIFVKDREFRIVQANQAFLNLYPEDMRDKVIGFDCMEGYDKEEAEEFTAMDRIAFAEGVSETIETIHFPDGIVRTLFTQKIRFEDSNGEEFILGLGRDVTEREELIDQLKTSNRELDDFAYIASHDLKEPIRAISNFANFLAKDYKDLIDDEGNYKIDRITFLTEHMKNLIDDLLYYSRIGRSELAVKKVDLNEIVTEVREVILASSEDDIEIKIPEKLPAITCDSVKVTELFRNLVNNAIKYNDKEKKVVEVGFKKAKGKNKEGIFYVKDNGIGIEERFHDEVFRIFQRLHSREAYGGGTGSGLTFVKKIIERHDGEIWIDSEKDKGTTFFFTLKMKKL